MPERTATVPVSKEEADAAYQVLAWAMGRGEYDFGSSRGAVAALADRLGRLAYD